MSLYQVSTRLFLQVNMIREAENHDLYFISQFKCKFHHNCVVRQVLIPIANGSEEVEVVTIADILRRAKVDVVVASVGKSTKILGSRGTKIIADKLIGDVSESIYDLIIVPVRLLKIISVIYTIYDYINAFFFKKIRLTNIFFIVYISFSTKGFFDKIKLAVVVPLLELKCQNFNICIILYCLGLSKD